MTLTMEKTPVKIQEHVTHQLRADDRIGAKDIRVTVDGTRVILEGSVETLADRRLAEADAAIVPGVRDVDNLLTVQSSGETKSDRELHDAIRGALRVNSTIDASQVNVTIEGGIATLSGFVPSFWQKMKVQDIAEHVPGVLAVNNELSAQRLREFADDVIREEIVAQFESNLKAAANTIDVHVNNGVVTLDGNVSDLSTYRGAENIAYYVRGVVIVINDLIIEPSAYKP